jgi:hypothetical protein
LFGAELVGRWLGPKEISSRYRLICFGYRLLGEDGIMRKWTFKGSGLLRTLAISVLSKLSGTLVPGWYDTHARLAGPKEA